MSSRGTETQRDSGDGITSGWARTGIGGPEATLSPEESIKACMSVLSNLSTENSGSLLSYNGETIEW